MKVDNITLMMFVLNFVEFCFILELIYSSDFHDGNQCFIQYFCKVREGGEDVMSGTLGSCPL